MADLIIKPNSATGDKLILQDRAGGAVLTTADSGATIANATLTSPTLNSPTLVTPALGTPASGVLTNATFPAGHILDVVSLATDAETTAGNTSWVLTGLDLSITPSASSSTILVFISSNMGGIDGSPRIKMTRTPSGGSEVDVNVNSTTGDAVGMLAEARLSGLQGGLPTQMYFEDSPSATVSVRYRVYIRSAETKNVFFGRSAYSGSPDGEYRVKSNMILMEVSG